MGGGASAELRPVLGVANVTLDRQNQWIDEWIREIMVDLVTNEDTDRRAEKVN